MDTLRSMELLILAVSHGGLATAGRHLGMSPAAATRHMNALEDRLGARLLNRSSRSLTLTEAGQDYYERARAILDQVADTEARVREFGYKPRGTVRVHARPLMGEQFITAEVPRFLRRYPEIDLVISMSNDDRNLHGHNLDVDIRVGRPEDSVYVMRRLGVMHRALVASPTYLTAAPSLDHPEQVRGHDCLVFTPYDELARWSFIHRRSGERLDVPVHGRFSSDYGAALRTMVLNGGGISVMPLWSVYDDLRDGKLVRLLPEWTVGLPGFNNEVYAVFLKDRHIAYKTRVFVDHLVEVFRKYEAIG